LLFFFALFCATCCHLVHAYVDPIVDPRAYLLILDRRCSRPTLGSPRPTSLPAKTPFRFYSLARAGTLFELFSPFPETLTLCVPHGFLNPIVLKGINSVVVLACPCPDRPKFLSPPAVWGCSHTTMWTIDRRACHTGCCPLVPPCEPLHQTLVTMLCHPRPATIVVRNC